MNEFIRDTNTSTLIVLIYHLAKYPDNASDVYDEIRKADISRIDVLASLPKLNAFINESQRLIPAALTFGSRKTPSQGINVDGVHIPGDVTVRTSRYTVCRSLSPWTWAWCATANNSSVEEAFEDAESFRPERWLDRSDLIRDRAAFAPFGVGKSICNNSRSRTNENCAGRRGCVGKRLAIMQLRLVLSQILLNYDVSFSPGTDVDAIERDMTDELTASPGKFNAVFAPRSNGLGAARE